MSIVWGAANGVYRLGVQVSRLSQTATGETWRAEVFLQKTSVTYNAGTILHLSGSWSGSFATPVTQGSDMQRLWAGDKTFNRPTGRDSLGRLSVSLSGFHHSVAGVSTNFTVSQQASSNMPAPRSVEAEYVDGQVVLSWVKNQPAGLQVGHFNIDRRSENSGWVPFRSIPAGNSSRFSIIDASISNGERYQYAVYQVAASNSRLVGRADSNWVSTALYAPVNVEAAREGRNIRLFWRDPNHNSSVFYRIFEGENVIEDNIPYGADSFLITNVSPSMKYVYMVQIVSVDGQESSKRESNEIILLTPPAPPILLSPQGGYVPAGEPFQFVWNHQTLDGTLQEEYRLRYRVDGGSWTTVTDSGSGNSFSFDTGLDDGVFLEWQVQTRGEHEDFSPWSFLASVTGAQRPTGKILFPIDNSEIEKAETPVILLSPTLSGMARWQIKATNTATNSLIDSASGYSQLPVKWQLSNLPNNSEIKLEAIISTKVDSLPIVNSFRVKYAAPLPPIVEAEWGEKASVTLQIVNPFSNIPVDINRVERKTPTGWMLVGEIPAGDSTIFFTDPLPPTNQFLNYRVIAVNKELGTQAISEPTSVETCPEKKIFLNWGNGWGEFTALQYNPGTETKHGFITEKSYVLAGDTLPTIVRGKATSRIQQLRGTLLPQKTSLEDVQNQLEQIRALATYPSIVALRTLDDGIRFGVISEVTYMREIWGGYQVSFTHTETTQ